MSRLDLASIDVFNYLGIDPTAPFPSAPEMRRLLRSLKLLLHPDKIASNQDAERAQKELGLDYATLDAIMSQLGLNNHTTATGYVARLQALRQPQWVSTWNPHGFGNGPLFEPLPSWSRRFAFSQTIPQSGSAIDLASFPPPGIQGAPRFDGADAMPAIAAEEVTDALVRMGNAVFVRRSGAAAACVAVARLRYNGLPSCISVVSIDSNTTSSLECHIWQHRKRIAAVQFRSLVVAANLGPGCMFAGMSQVWLLGVFSRVPCLVLELYVKKFLRHLAE
ncbi:uncharacterized protein IWZ02DRAFT_157046 [Phyllosticta citriasiana]|uniref:J domain-containing protein n=1 Tax=Phyllosticta citriasiana TaxID=595635 RepID=A0ABR1K802_9PEZI